MTKPPLLAAVLACVALAMPVRLVASGPAVAVSHVDMNRCLRIAAGQASADERRCPGFIVSALADAGKMCREVGGRIKAMPQATLWAIDVDADDKAEYLFDTTQNVECVGAPSILSCGSQICGLTLYAQRSGTWRAIGGFALMEPSGIALAPGSQGYADLRVACGEAHCTEIQHYRWTGSAYALSGLEVRGHAVDIPAARGQLWTLTRAAAVLAEPRRGAEALARYPANTEVVVLGQARAARYLYVSPCNACAPGFVEAGWLRRAYRR